MTKVDGARSGELQTVQALRFMAATMVVLYHTYPAILVAAGRPAKEANPFFFGEAGVHIFFCISGFIMFSTTYSGRPQSRKTSSFLMRRIIRLYPFYWIVCALYIVFYYLIGLPHHLTAKIFIGALGLLPGYASEIIGPGWTLAYEIFFYACFAPLVSARPMINFLVISTVLTCVAVTGAVIPEFKHFLPVADSLLLEFVLGMCVAFTLLSQKDFLQRRWQPILLLALLLFIVGQTTLYGRLPPLLTVAVPSTLLLAAAVGWETGTQSRPWLSALARWGDFSYAEYLLHILLIDACILAVGQVFYIGSWPVAWTLAISAFICVIAAMVNNTVEKPLLAKLRPLLL